MVNSLCYSRGPPIACGVMNKGEQQPLLLSWSTTSLWSDEQGVVKYDHEHCWNVVRVDILLRRNSQFSFDYPQESATAVCNSNNQNQPEKTLWSCRPAVGPRLKGVTGDGYQSLMYLFKISVSSISLIIPEYVAIVKTLCGYVKVPQNLLIIANYGTPQTSRGTTNCPAASSSRAVPQVLSFDISTQYVSLLTKWFPILRYIVYYLVSQLMA
uniref:Uncharacterized protein n=1 Tax=Timema cristinae TaxID=61476 RepID=A0A7R9D6Q9_TIMCR|nr:unnamed protein product [Timema cristinae]